MSDWCAAQRQLWIADMLAVYGFINRNHLQRKFGISQPQASKDLGAFARANPTAMRYDVSFKFYVRGDAIDIPPLPLTRWRRKR
jgi:hypothetical protein